MLWWTKTRKKKRSNIIRVEIIEIVHVERNEKTSEDPRLCEKYTVFNLCLCKMSDLFV